MSTLALVGLLVVLLVAIGIAGFLLRGRRGSSGDPDAPPRTVAELVDRRRGEDDGAPDDDADTTTGPIHDDDAGVLAPRSGHTAAGAEATVRPAVGTTTAGADATAWPGAEPTTGPVGDVTAGSDRDVTAGSDRDATAGSGRDAAPGSVRDATAGSGRDAAPGSGPGVTAGSGRDAAPASDVDIAAPSDAGGVAGHGVDAAPGPGDPAGPDTGSTLGDESEDTDTAPLGASPSEPAPDDPATPRPGSDADTGPSSPPWSRGFVAGRQITPPPPAHTPEPEQPVGAEAGRPSPPPRQESRSPVDPDLVKRVTSPVPSATGRRASDPDTEREFREARDRMAGPAVVRHSPVPEQSSRSPESAEPTPSPRPRPSPVTRAGNEDTSDRSGGGGSAGVAAAGTGAAAVAAAVAISRSGPADEDEHEDPAESSEAGSQATRTSPVPRAADRFSSATGEEPAPRPSPRVMRSAGPTVVAPSGPEVTGDDLAGPEPSEAGSVDAAAPAVAGTAPVGDPGATDRAGRDTGAAEPEQVVAFTGPSALRLGPVPSTPVQDVDVHVSDRSERPLAGVALSVVDGAGAPAGSGTTGADGDARLRAPGAGQYLLVASVDGYQTRVAPYAVADEPVRVPVTLARSSSLRGIVRGPAGEPRQGVPVSLGQDGEAVARTDTGSDGTYRFPDLAAGHYQLTTGERPGATVHVPPEADVERDVRSHGTESV